jgi:3-hydroxy-9,10-secoandrosta-1,3,5(10)-triene-9,17-dione monooxygenase reductase component
MKEMNMQGTTEITPLMLRSNLGKYPTGVSVITSADQSGRPVGGMTAGTFTSVSLDPPLVAFLPAKSSSSWPLIQETGRFCVNVLGVEQEALCKAFSVSGADKFSGVEWRRSLHGLPVMDGVVMWVDCALREVVDAGDHLIVLGEVLEIGSGEATDPLVFHGGKFRKFLPV